MVLRKTISWILMLMQALSSASAARNCSQELVGYKTFFAFYLGNVIHYSGKIVVFFHYPLQPIPRLQIPARDFHSSQRNAAQCLRWRSGKIMKLLSWTSCSIMDVPNFFSICYFLFYLLLLWIEKIFFHCFSSFLLEYAWHLQIISLTWTSMGQVKQLRTQPSVFNFMKSLSCWGKSVQPETKPRPQITMMAKRWNSSLKYLTWDFPRERLAKITVGVAFCDWHDVPGAWIPPQTS